MQTLKTGWRKVKVGDLCKIKHGYAFKGEYFSDRGRYIVLTPGNFTEQEGLKLKGNKEKYYTGDFPKQYLLKSGQMLVVMTDLKQSAPYLGAPGVVKVDDELLHNQRLGLITDVNDDLIDEKFLYWIFQSHNYRSQVRGSASGATVKHTSPDRIYNCVVEIPEAKNLQIKIASILSAFDNLIDNNSKRIKLLEQTAQLLYKEWFVNFSFPGHEEAEFTETGTRFGKIPSEWTLSPFSEIVKINPQISFPQNKEHRFVTMGDLFTGAFVHVPDEKVTKAGKKFGHKDTLFARITPCLENGKGGYVRLNDEDEIVFGSTEFIVLREKVLPSTLVYLISRDERFRKRAQKSMVGASGRQRVQEKCFDSYLFPVAPKPLLDKFEAICEPIFNGVYNLSRQNHMLAKVRDFLLPYLIKE